MGGSIDGIGRRNQGFMQGREVYGALSGGEL